MAAISLRSPCLPVLVSVVCATLLLNFGTLPLSSVEALVPRRSMLAADEPGATLAVEPARRRLHWGFFKGFFDKNIEITKQITVDKGKIRIMAPAMYRTSISGDIS